MQKYLYISSFQRKRKEEKSLKPNKQTKIYAKFMHMSLPSDGKSAESLPQSSNWPLDGPVLAAIITAFILVVALVSGAIFVSMRRPQPLQRGNSKGKRTRWDLEKTTKNLEMSFWREFRVKRVLKAFPFFRTQMLKIFQHYAL